MNLLLISSTSPFESIGGIERYVSNFIDYCQTRNDILATVLLPSQIDKAPQTDGNVTLVFSRALGQPDDMSHRQMALEFHRQVERVIDDCEIDVICAENFHLGLPPAFSLQLNMIAGLKSIPIVLRLHSFAVTKLQTELINQLNWHRLSCVSRSVAGDCFHKGADITNISTDYLGVNTADFKPDPTAKGRLCRSLGLPAGSRLITTASRIILGRNDILRQKGFITTIKAFSKLSARHPDLRLVIAVGQAPATLANEFNEAYKRLLGYLTLHDIQKKTVVKMFALDEMPELYQASDIFVLASENETFGQVYIEAMACGAAVIGTKVGGIPEIISDQRNGFLVAPGDAIALAQRIETLVTNDELRQKLVAAGQKTVAEKFSADKQFASFLSQLETVVAENAELAEAAFCVDHRGGNLRSVR